MFIRKITPTTDSTADKTESLNSEFSAGQNMSGKLTYDVISPEERKWIDIGDNDIKHITLDSTLYGQGDVYHYDNEYYVSDFHMQKVYRFSRTGKYINHIGEGKGAGPGEFSHFVDYIVNDGGIFVADVNGINISWFTYDGKLLETFVVNSNPNNIAFYDDSLAVFYMMKGKIQKYSKSGKAGSVFGEIIGDQGFPMDTGGYFSGYENKWVVYSSGYSSTLMIFDTKGILTRTIQTVDRQPFPRTKAVNGGFRAPESSRYASDVAVDEGKIYVNILVNEETKYTIIDRYEFSSGNYIDSVRLPLPAARIDVKSGLVVSSYLDNPGLIEFNYESISTR